MAVSRLAIHHFHVTSHFAPRRSGRQPSLGLLVGSGGRGLLLLLLLILSVFVMEEGRWRGTGGGGGRGAEGGGCSCKSGRAGWQTRKAKPLVAAWQEWGRKSRNLGRKGGQHAGREAGWQAGGWWWGDVRCDKSLSSAVTTGVFLTMR